MIANSDSGVRFLTIDEYKKYSELSEKEKDESILGKFVSSINNLEASPDESDESSKEIKLTKKQLQLLMEGKAKLVIETSVYVS